MSEAQAEIWSWALEGIKLNKQLARYMEDHSGANPVGMLSSLEMVRTVIDRLSGKQPKSDPCETVPRCRASAKHTKPGPTEDELPVFEAYDLPD